MDTLFPAINRTPVYKSRTNTIKKLPMLQHFQTHTGVVPSTSKSYLIGNNRKFTWNQVFSAAGLQNATSPPLHTINCRSTQYSSLVGGDGDGDGQCSGTFFQPDKQPIEFPSLFQDCLGFVNPDAANVSSKLSASLCRSLSFSDNLPMAHNHEGLGLLDFGTHT